MWVIEIIHFSELSTWGNKLERRVWSCLIWESSVVSVSWDQLHQVCSCLISANPTSWPQCSVEQWILNRREEGGHSDLVHLGDPGGLACSCLCFSLPHGVTVDSVLHSPSNLAVLQIQVPRWAAEDFPGRTIGFPGLGPASVMPCMDFQGYSS